MTLAPVILDDLRWQEMVSSVRGRIAGASGGRWTLHAPVDPGVTLLELFAWLAEQRLYWIDQVPEPLVRALLALAGEVPRGARPATTPLVLDGPAWSEVAAGTRFRLLDPDRPRTFSSTAPLSLLPVVRLGLETAAGDRTAALAAGRPVPFLGAGGGAAEATLVLWLASPPPSPPPAGLAALLLELAAPPGVQPGWSPDAADAGGDDGPPPPALLRFSYSAAGGSRRFAEGAIVDGTGGLRRSGLLRFPVPADWQPAGPAAADGALPFRLTIATERAAFTAPPRLRRLAANAVTAEHAEEVTADPAALAAQARAWRKLPGQTLALADEAPPPLADTVELALRERPGADGVETWRPVADLAFQGPADRVFTVDRDAGLLRFGDGLTGRVPVPLDSTASEIAVRYRGGGGEAGNLGAVRRWEGVGAAGLTAASPLPAAGGREAESVAAAGERLAGELRRRRRAVVRTDYEELARTTPGVAIARARAAVGDHPLHPCTTVPGVVTVFVVPWAGRPDTAGWADDRDRVAAPAADPGALAAVAARLEGTRLAGTRVFVRPVRYRPVALAVTMASGSAVGSGLERRLAARLGRYLDPLVGGESGTGWPFGEPVRPSALLRQAQEAAGRQGEVAAVAVGLDGDAPREDCNDLAVGRHDLVYLARFELRRGAAAGTPPGPGGLP